MKKHRALIVAAALVATCGAWFGLRRAEAQSTPTTLFVTGLHLTAVNPAARVTILNTSTSSADFYSLTFQVYHADGRRAADPVAPATPLLSGRSITFDVAQAVNSFRAGLEVGPFAGPLTLVVRGTSCADTGTCPPNAVPRPFGPAVLQVEALQTEGTATYDAGIAWYVAQ